MSGHTVVFSTVPLWPIHHAETLELVHRSLADGDEVTLVSCEGDLFACAANRDHKRVLCQICRAQTERTHRSLVPREVRRRALAHAEFIRQGSCDEIVDWTTLRDFSHRGVPVGAYALSQLANENRDYLVDVAAPDMLQRARRLTENACALYDSVRALADSESFTRGYVWNGRRACDGPIFHALKDSGAEAHTFITGGADNRIFTSPYRTVQEGMLRRHGLDEVLVGSAASDLEDEGLAYLEGYRTNRLATREFRPFGSSPLAAEKQWPSADTKRPRCLILMSTVTEAMGMTGTWEFYRDAPYEWVCALAASTPFVETFETVVKWHPNQQGVGPREGAHISDVMRRSDRFVHIAPTDSSMDAYGLALAADLVIATGSTVATWAAAHGIRTIRLGPNWHESLEGGMEHHPSVESLLDELRHLGARNDPAVIRRSVVWYSRRGSSMRFADVEAAAHESILHAGKPRRITGFEVRVRWRAYKTTKRLVRLARRVTAKIRILLGR